MIVETYLLTTSLQSNQKNVKKTNSLTEIQVVVLQPQSVCLHRWHTEAEGLSLSVTVSASGFWPSSYSVWHSPLDIWQLDCGRSKPPLKWSDLHFSELDPTGRPFISEPLHCVYCLVHSFTKTAFFTAVMDFPSLRGRRRSLSLCRQ